MKIPETAAGIGKMNSMLVKCLTVVLIAVVSLLFLNTMMENRDGRSTVISGEGTNEYASTDDEIRLKNILECISGVGEVRVMINGSAKVSENTAASVFSSTQKASEDKGGVIVVAEGAGNPVVQSRITDAVSTVCDIEPSKVVVFELKN
jgi:hypothetical protein